MDADLIWLLIGVTLVIAEILTLTLVVGMLAVGALVAAGVAFAGLGPIAQLLAFGASSTALLLLVRPPVKKALDRGGTSDRTDPRELSGATAVVTQLVGDESGQVRLNGELWRARPYAGSPPLDVGHRVTVAEVQGATLLVYSPDLP